MDKEVKIWQVLISNVLVGITTGLIILLFTRAGQHIDKNDEIIRSKADISYVDKQDEAIKGSLKAHQIDDNNKDLQVMELIKSMDHKIDILIAKK